MSQARRSDHVVPSGIAAAAPAAVVLFEVSKLARSEAAAAGAMLLLLAEAVAAGTGTITVELMELVAI